MKKSGGLTRSVISLCVMGAAMTSASLILVSAQSRKAARKGRTPRTAFKTCNNSVKRFEVGKPIKLSLQRCSGQIELPDLGINSTYLNIEDNKIILGTNDGGEIQGEVSGFALSQYCTNANLGLFFNRMENVPFTNPNWTPPKVFSLRLMQITTNEFTLTPAPGANLLTGTGGAFKCEEISGSTTEP